MNRSRMMYRGLGLGAGGLLACWAVMAAPPAAGQAFDALLTGSFRTEGIAHVDRLKQDAGQQACSTGRPLPPQVAQRVQAEALASVKAPADGKYLGDWREGEKLAQSGRGMTWTDKSAAPAANGANCYNCHQITKAELSFGTIGPSLYQYGRQRGVVNPTDPVSAAIVQYTWAKLYNAWSYNACSNMPRFGHKELLDEAQLQHVMALLLDPQSPVNAP